MTLVFILLFLFGALISAYTAPTGLVSLPIGTIVQFAGDIVPDQWLLCDGSAVTRRVYAELFFTIGTLYGVGDHVRTFNLPDFRGRFPLGLNNKMGQRSGVFQGGASAITLTQNELPSHSHGKGSLSSASAGNHTHSYDDPGHNHGGNTGSGQFSGGSWSMNPRGGAGNDQGSHSHTINRDLTRINIRAAGVHSHAIVGETAAVGAGKPVSIMPPYQTVNYIIYAGPILSETIG
jgi:microcystin-dependent protein